MKVVPTDIAEVLMIEPDTFEDHRGFLLESFNRARFAGHGIDLDILQVNHSRSRGGVLRGLHFQVDRPYGKLVNVARGEAFDVAVDMRRGSPTFGRWAGANLSDRDHRCLWIPPGFAHGFVALSETLDLIYTCTGIYDRDDDYTVAWNDPDIGIDWPGADFELSDKDRNASKLSELAGLPLFRA